MKISRFFITILVILSTGCTGRTTQEIPIQAFCIDYNWGPGGAHGFAKPGLWADADPIEQVKWYKDMGCNTIQTFAVSCNGYAWYKNGIIPEQPGLKDGYLLESRDSLNVGAKNIVILARVYNGLLFDYVKTK